jgi:hypothetical protein
MKVLNLGCTRSHVFEGWFGSEAELADQLERGLLSCPMCGDKAVRKLPSAPRLNLGSGREDRPEGAPATTEARAAVSPEAQSQAALWQELRRAMGRAEDVGDRFAAEARRMHQGEVAPRGIKGRTTVGEAVELLEEGIAVLPLPDALDGLDGPLH